MDEIQLALRERYAYVHPLMFTRSVEHSTSHSDLFDILDSVPSEYPIMWDSVQRRWIHTPDLLQNHPVELRDV